jgi:glycosyltransferase involved in cell wall biosynthesis
LEAFAQQQSIALVMVGNWANSEYGRELRERYAGVVHLHLLDPIYDLGKLKSLRAGSTLYVHGHSAGGTNPSLVEAMHFGLPVLAFDCDFNRATTENKALFFGDALQLRGSLDTFDPLAAQEAGQAMLEIARRRYTWEVVAKQYFDLIRRA